MHHVDLTGLRVAVLAADGFEQVELTVPVEALEDHGAEVEIVSLRPGRIRGLNGLYPGKKVRVDRTLHSADADDYDALLLPGGFVNPDFLRQSEAALDFVRKADFAGKPIAVICHAPWLLVSAGLVVRRHLTSWPGIRDDVRNAGGVWRDEPVVRDRNWVSSRGPHDLPQFKRAMLELFAEHVRTAPVHPAEAPRTEKRRAPVGRVLLGAAATAGVAWLISRQLTREEPLEYVEVVDLEPESVAVIEEVWYEDDDTVQEGAYAGGIPYPADAEYTPGPGIVTGTETAFGIEGTGAANPDRPPPV